MSRQTSTSERVRAVLLASVMVLSMVGGAVAVAGQTVADGSLDDATAATDTGADDATDPTDTEDSTGDGATDAADTDSSGDSSSDSSDGSDGGSADATDADETADAGDADADEAAETADTAEEMADTAEGTVDTAEETTDETADTAERTVDTAEETTDEATGAADDVTGGATTGIGLPVVDGALGTRQAAGSREGSSGSGSSGPGAAAPASVAVTAGASAQAPIAEAGEGPATLRLTEEAAGDFPESGTARLTLDDDGTVAFDTDATSATATADGATAEVTDVTARAVTIAVDDVDPNTTSSLALEGLRFTSGDDAAVEAATWEFGDVSGTTTVTPERLEFTGLGNDVPRGADEVPGDGAKFFANAPDGAKTDGFHAQNELLAVQIPEAYREDISFDTSSDPRGITKGGDCALPGPIAEQRTEDVRVTENSVLIDLSCQINREEYLMVEDIRFNVTGATAVEPAEFVARLDGLYKPVNRTETVFVEGGNPVSAHAPVVEPGGTTVAADRTAASGDGDVRVDLTDDIGGMMAAGTTVTVELADTGVTFDESQSLEVVTTSGDTAAPTVEAVDGRTVVLEVQETTAAGDSFQLRRSGDRAIRFDTGPDATDASLLVTTTPGGEDVTQSTGTVVSVGERSTDDGSGGDGSGDDGSGGDGGGGDGSDGDDSGDDGSGDDGSGGDGSDGDGSSGSSGDGSSGDSSSGDGSNEGDGSGDGGSDDSDGGGSSGSGNAGGGGAGGGGDGSSEDRSGDGSGENDGSSDGSGGDSSGSVGEGGAGGGGDESGDGSDDGAGGDGGAGSTGGGTTTGDDADDGTATATGGDTDSDDGSSADSDDDSIVSSLQEIAGGGPARFVALVIAMIAAAVLVYGSRAVRE